MSERDGDKATFDVLNGLRGVAAIAVVNMHLSPYFGALHPANVALAVDFFFVLSGFVIAYAYEDRLRAGLAWGRFFQSRIIRLYPMYLLGLAMGAAVVWTLDRPANVSAYMATLGLNILMAPAPVAIDAYATPLFPLNFPAWSLFMEVVANLAYAALAPRLGARLLAVIVCAGFVGLVATGVTAGTLDQGTQRLQLAGGLARVTFSFFAGVALYRLWRRRPVRSELPPVLLFVLLILPLLFKPGAPFGWLYELAVITLYMPAIIWLGAGARPLGVWRPVCVGLGALSYPLYMIHAPVWMAIRAFEGWRPSSLLSSLAPWSGIGLTLGLCGLAWWLDTAIDFPLRQRLSEALLHRRTHAGDPDPQRQHV